MKMVKFAFAFGLLVVSLISFAAEPTISVTATPRYPWSGMVDLSFTITGDSGVKYDTSFTATDIAGGTNLTMKTIYKSNGSSAALTNSLAAGSYKWVWNAAADMGECICPRAKVFGNIEKVIDSEHALYMVIDLSSGSSSTSYPIRYLESLPTGGWGNSHKGDLLVLRKLLKGTNTAGGSMASDMWVGVFEVTQLQYKRVMNANPSSHTGDRRPLEHAGYFACKDFLSKLSSRSGSTFRLPTQDEWRYACRAGSTAKPYSATSTTARYPDTATDGKGGYSTYHTTVGSYKANAWGLYDMLGNVGEWTSTGASGTSSSYTAYSLGGYATATITAGMEQQFEGTPNDSTKTLGGSIYGRDDAEGFRVFGIVQ